MASRLGKRRKTSAKRLPRLAGERLVERPDVDGHHRHEVDRLSAMLVLVGVQGARDGAQEHVVERRTDEAAGLLEPGKGEWLGPHEALAVARDAADDTPRVRGQQQVGDDLSGAEGQSGGVRHGGPGAFGAQTVPPRQGGRPGEPETRRDGPCPRVRRRGEGQGREVGGRRWSDEVAGPAVGVLGEAEQHPGQGDAVGQRVVDAEDERGARPVTVDEVDLPERAGAVERARQVLLDVCLQARRPPQPGSARRRASPASRAAPGRSPGRPPSGARTAPGAASHAG